MDREPMRFIEDWCNVFEFMVLRDESGIRILDRLWFGYVTIWETSKDTVTVI